MKSSVAERVWKRKTLIEFAGLPGSGKTTVAGFLPADWHRRSDAKKSRLPLALRLDLYNLSWRFFWSLRPRELGNLGKFIGLADRLAYYTNEFDQPLILDQGLVQRLWSILVWRDGFDRTELERLVQSLAPWSPTLIVWIRIPVEVAVRRVAERPHGRSRFDKRPTRDIYEELSREERNFELLLGLYRRHTHSEVLEVSGEDRPEQLASEVLAYVDRMKVLR